MRQFKSENRIKKITEALSRRQFSLSVLLENIHDRHNVSAIFRTCDAVGISLVNLLYYIEKTPKLSVNTSKSALKWVESEIYKDVETCYESLRSQGFKIYASMLDENSVSLYDLNLTEKVVFVMGNEHRGVSEKAAKLADKTYYIPMLGMVQSLNVSIATGVSIYEAMRQRQQKGMYNESSLSKEEFDTLIDKWCRKK